MNIKTTTQFILSFTALSILFAGCRNHDDFEFAGTVIDYEECTSMLNFGYAIALTTPDSIGGRYTTRDSLHYNNVVVVYGADRLLKENDKVSGRIFLDPNYSKTECYFHFQRKIPEAQFTQLKVEK